jgi:hypothetical protein
MSYTYKGQQHFKSTKTTSKTVAKKILDRREGEIVMQMFNVGCQREWALGASVMVSVVVP